MTHYAPSTECLRCGVTYGENRSEQQLFGDPIRCSTGEMIHLWKEPKYKPLAEAVQIVEEGLSTGLSTDEIAQSLNSSYEALAKRLRQGQVPDLHQRVLRLREEEWESRRHYLPRALVERKRCAHGWWSPDGECQHKTVDMSALVRKRMEGRRRNQMQDSDF